MHLLPVVVLALLVQEPPGAVPAPKGGGWIKRHEGFVAQAKKGGINLLFLGDSITDAWRGGNGRETWEKEFAGYGAANFGISGDRTQHVLWRLKNGEFEGVKPKGVVLMIGTNNIGQRNAEPPGSAIAGVRAIVKEIHDRSPKTRILLLGVFPRAEKPDHPLRAKVKTINDAIRKLDDGGKLIRYLDIGGAFRKDDGTLTREIMPDFLHLSKKGYRIWADAIRKPVAEMMEE